MTSNSDTSEKYLGTEQTPGYVPNGDERTLAILVHVLSLFFWIFPALMIYLVKKDESPFVAAHAKEELNFQITLTVLYLILLAIIFIGWLFLWVPYVFQVILNIVAAIKASDNKLYSYPINWRIIK